MAADDPLLTAWLQARSNPPDATDLREQRKLLLDFLEVLDSLDRLLAWVERDASPQNTPQAQWAGHLLTLRGQLLEAFKHADVSFFDSHGQRFNPARHEAVEIVRQPGAEDYRIVEELARGCEWRGQVLRFARVVVARTLD